MEKRNVCVNSHEQKGAELQRTSQQVSSDIADLGCSFTRVMKNGKPALLARMNVYLQSASADTLLMLLHHVEELNVRLPVLRASVRVDDGNGYLLVLHGLTCGDITAPNMNQFIDRLTQDFGTFLSYARTHNIALALSR